ncbi:hypothetical protein GYH30_037637 [Glycine max]|uniref:Uncharacterized protein n=1 Tax=Glycine max TaxID=3847 RepID=A0A0R0H401_SOYBN|nr:hypothetical protein GYH30_037637 [Glycine max]
MKIHVIAVELREEEVNRFRESLETLDKFFKWLFGIIAFKIITPTGEALFITHPCHDGYSFDDCTLLLSATVGNHASTANWDLTINLSLCHDSD